MNIPYSFHPGFVLRSPRLPITVDITGKQIDNAMHDAAFLESIYLASTVLYDKCIKFKNGQLTDEKEIDKLKKSILKYYMRSISRCTPFGLFAGCGMGRWTGEEDKIILNNTIKRHTRFDMQYLCSLSQYLAAQPGIKEHLRYYTNSSIYQIGNEIRYVEYKYVNGDRIYQISAVASYSYLDKLLSVSKNGILLDELYTFFSGEDLTAEEISGFVNELLESQLLVSELEPAITGEEFIYQLLTVLRRIATIADNAYVQKVIIILETVDNKLQHIDATSVNNVEAYREITQLISDLGVAFEESKLFQADMVRSIKKGGLPATIQKELFEVLDILNKLSSINKGNPDLESFAQRFYERYEEREMPILEVLDTETGIGYPESVANVQVPLVSDLHLNAGIHDIQKLHWGPVEQFLMRKVSESYQTGATVIEITDKDLDFVNKDTWDDLPASMHLVFRMLDTEKMQLYIESCGGVSGIGILSRFAHADTDIKKLIDEVVTSEETKNPGVIFAEVIHLPESRTGNVLLHPAFRKFEIPFLTKSSLPDEQQLALQDIMVSVKNGMILLRHKKTGKCIAPRLSNAHNYHIKALPGYQFLCDLQLQKQRGVLDFSWGSIRYIVKTLPRVQYKNIILSAASWQLTASDFKHLLHIKGDAEKRILLNEFIVRWKLPKMVVLADGDNELLIDFSNDLLISLFLKIVSNRNSIELREFFYPGKNTVTDHEGKLYASQAVAVLLKNVPAYPAVYQQKSRLEHNSSGSFSAAPEWLYYKIYCGVKSADKILTDAIKPIVDTLTGKNLLDRFFFIRFTDPLFHIRLRICLKDNTEQAAVAKLIDEYMQTFRRSGHIWKVQTDTYNRELERYGYSTIGHAETIFHYDSISVLKMLSETWGEERENIRWLWAIRAVDGLFDVFNISSVQRLNICDTACRAFAAEFNEDRRLREQVNAKYRQHRGIIENMLNKKNTGDAVLPTLAAILDEKHEGVAPVAALLLELENTGQAEVPLFDLLGSYIHLLINRAIPAKARLHEMVIYNFLLKHYKGVLAQTEKKL